MWPSSAPNAVVGGGGAMSSPRREAAAKRPARSPTAAQPQDTEAWPRGQLKPERYRDAIEDRFRAVLRAASPHPLIWQISSIVAGHIGEGLVAGKVIDAVNNYLREAKLD